MFSSEIAKRSLPAPFRPCLRPAEPPALRVLRGPDGAAEGGARSVHRPRGRPLLPGRHHVALPRPRGEAPGRAERRRIAGHRPLLLARLEGMEVRELAGEVLRASRRLPLHSNNKSAPFRNAARLPVPAERGASEPFRAVQGAVPPPGAPGTPQRSRWRSPGRIRWSTGPCPRSRCGRHGRPRRTRGISGHQGPGGRS